MKLFVIMGACFGIQSRLLPLMLQGVIAGQSFLCCVHDSEQLADISAVGQKEMHFYKESD